MLIQPITSDCNNIVYDDMLLKDYWHILGEGKENGEIIRQLF